MLRLQHLTRRFGGVAAIDDLSLHVHSGETLGVIGPNGAGKSTLINLISGALPSTSGSIELSGVPLTALSADARTRLGVGRTHQIPRPFARMSVRDNLALAARHARRPPGRSDLSQYCLRILQRTGLADVADIMAGSLPLLRRKRLELARALALQPRLLLLDEIGAGLVDSETRLLIELIQTLRAEVESIVLIEHVMDVITACCSRTAVLATGRLLTIGATPEVLRDPAVAAVYLGTGTGTGTRSTPLASAATAGAAPLLELHDVSVNYGGVRALRAVSLQIRPGEALALLGANGAGKTTLVRAISGVVPMAGGNIQFSGQPLRGLQPDEIAARGIGHCMEGRRIFASLSVEENLLLALPVGDAARRRARLDHMYELFPALKQRRRKPGTAMSGGQQQMLAIARAMMNEPQLLLFDEISLGLAPIAVEQLYSALERIRAAGVAMLVVEQDIERGLQLADRACVLVHGALRLSGRPDEIRAAPELRALYVGAG
jgi:ABC-type branched-subunit amino acid transport system ATPase component